MNASLDLATLSIKIGEEVVFTAPTGWAPYPQLMGEIEDMLDNGTLDRATARRLGAELQASEIGRAHARTKAWQGFR